MHELVIGVDEIATERQLVEGWTYCVLPASEALAFEQAAAGLTGASSRTYHGKKFKKAHAAEYEAFLRAVRTSIENSSGPARLLFTLNDVSYKTTLLAFLDRVVANSLQQAGVSGDGSIQILQTLFPGIATLQRLLSDEGSQCTARLEIDQDDVTRALGSSSVVTPKGQIALERVLAALYRGYRRHQFPASPELKDPHGIAILRDSKSRLVQAADVMGNFAMSYALHHLGDPSSTRATKAAVFASVFGDLVHPGMISDAAVLQGNEMTWKQSGALTLRIAPAS